MKILFCVLMILALGACNTFPPKVEELKASKQCQAWTKDSLGFRQVATVEGELSRHKVSCLLWNMYICKYEEYSYSSDQEIKSSITGSAATLNGKKMKIDTFGGKSVDSFELKKNQAEYTMQLPLGLTAKKNVEYNDQCTTRQAALGVMALVSY